MMPTTVSVRLKLPNRPGALAKVLAVADREDCSLGGVDFVSVSPSHTTGDLMLRLRDREHLEKLVGALEGLPEVQVVHVADGIFVSHAGGKIEVRPRRQLQGPEDLSLIYTPGVAAVSEAVAEDPDAAYKFTMKGNSVAIVTDGSAVLGLGDLGPLAALPVMEGKAVLFKRFAGIDAFPLCLGVREPREIVDVVLACAPTFGGINLEDIASPRCFEVEEKLSSLLDIPVFHDDQHGTAIVTLAGLINALKVVGKDIRGVRVVVSGAGAAGVGIVKILKSAGVDDIVVCDRKGAIARDDPPSQPVKSWIAYNTNRRCVHGSLKEVIVGADVFIGVSGSHLLGREDILKMAEKPIVFALANPDPEVEPEEIYDVAGVVATGRSDYPNQINNALAFPGFFRGVLDCRAGGISDEMFLAAAKALADMVPERELSAENIIPSLFDKNVTRVVAEAVMEAGRNMCRVPREREKVVH